MKQQQVKVALFSNTEAANRFATVSIVGHFLKQLGCSCFTHGSMTSQPENTRHAPAGRPLTHAQLHHVGVIRPAHDEGDEDHRYPR